MFADTVPEAVLREIADRLETGRPRFLSDLAVTAPAADRPFRVKVWQDATAWAAEVRGYFGRPIDTAGYVSGPDELRVLAVSAVARNATHELVHCVSLRANATIANNPRWLWESVALYENEERVDPRTLGYMVAGDPPTLDELDADVTVSRRIYEVGYLIGEFVVVRGGPRALAELVRANGDTARVLGLTRSAFEQAWYVFVRDRYLS